MPFSIYWWNANRNLLGHLSGTIEGYDEVKKLALKYAIDSCTHITVEYGGKTYEFTPIECWESVEQ